MKNKASLRFKLIVGFLAVTVPLFCLLIYINYYAMDVVRSQVGQSTKNMLSMYMNEIDRTLEDGENYIYNYIARNSDMTTYATSELGSANYFFAKSADSKSDGCGYEQLRSCEYDFYLFSG